MNQIISILKKGQVPKNKDPQNFIIFDCNYEVLLNGALSPISCGTIFALKISDMGDQVTCPYCKKKQNIDMNNIKFGYEIFNEMKIKIGNSYILKPQIKLEDLQQIKFNCEYCQTEFQVREDALITKSISFGNQIQKKAQICCQVCNMMTTVYY